MARLRTSALLLAGFVTFAGAAWAEPPEEKPSQRTDRYGDPLPGGAVLRLGTTRFRHHDSINHLVFSPNGKILASVNFLSGSVRLWDARTGKQFREFRESSDSGNIAFSPDGATLAIGAVFDGIIRIRHVASGRQMWRLSVEPNTLACIAYAPDGKRLAAAGRDGTFVVWGLTTGKEVRRMRREEASLLPLWRIALTADGRLLACGGPKPDAERKYGYWQPSVMLDWEINTGKVITEGKGPSDEINFAAYAPDGGTLFYGGEEVLGAWQTATDKSLRTVRQEEPGFLSFALSPDGKTIASTSRGGIVQLWEAATFKEIKKFNGANYRAALAFSPDGKTLASAEDGVIRLWDTGTGKRLDPFQGQEGGIAAVVFAQRSQRIVSVGWWQAL